MKPQGSELKMAPGHRRIISALQKGERSFTELRSEAKLDATTLSQYLRELTERHIVEKSPETGEYYFPKALQPLQPETYPTGWQTMGTLIGDIGFYGDFIKGLEAPAERQEALTEFLRIHFPLLATSLVHAVNEACGYKDPRDADEFIQRSLEFYIVPWAHLLGIISFQLKEESDKPLGQIADTFIKIAEDAYRAFDKRFPTGEAQAKTTR